MEYVKTQGSMEGIRDIAIGIRNLLKEVIEKEAKIARFATNVEIIMRDRMPEKIVCTDEDQMLDPELSDEGFIERLAKIKTDNNGVRVLAAYVATTRKFHNAIADFKRKNDKLANSLGLMSADGKKSDPEYAVYSRKLQSNKNVIKVLEKRMDQLVKEFTRERARIIHKVKLQGQALTEVIGKSAKRYAEHFENNDIGGDLKEMIFDNSKIIKGEME